MIALFNPFGWWQRHRAAKEVARHAELEAAQARQDAALRQEREHQLAMLRVLVEAVESFTEGQAAVAEAQRLSITELARGFTANAEALTSWVKSFQAPSSMPSSQPPPLDEDRAEFFDALGVDPTNLPDGFPQELALAFQLQQGIRDLAGTDELNGPRH